MLLDIVARSLYSDKEVFVRELVSNASDALEKFRYTIHTAGEGEKDFTEQDRALEIHIGTNKQDRVLSIQDTGIGMTKEELIANLGTIARSGSKHFLEQVFIAYIFYNTKKLYRWTKSTILKVQYSPLSSP